MTGLRGEGFWFVVHCRGQGVLGGNTMGESLEDLPSEAAGGPILGGEVLMRSGRLESIDG